MPSTTRTLICFALAVVAHVVGGLLAWATGMLTVSFDLPPDTAARLAGNSHRVAVFSLAPEPQPVTPPVDLPALDPKILIKPREAQVNNQTFHQVSTDVSKPTPTELAMVQRMLAPVAVDRRQTDVSSPEPDQSSSAPVRPVSRRRAATAPRVVTQPAMPSVPQQSVGSKSATPAQLLNNRPPTYPASAIAARQQGRVLLRVHIGSAGDVAEVEVVSSSGHAILDASAVRAVKTWRFTPAQRDGRPVASTVRLPVRFALD